MYTQDRICFVHGRDLQEDKKRGCPRGIWAKGLCFPTQTSHPAVCYVAGVLGRAKFWPRARRPVRSSGSSVLSFLDIRVGAGRSGLISASSRKQMLDFRTAVALGRC